MLRNTVVACVALFLAVGTVGVVTHLHAGADASRDAQVRLADVEKALGDLEELPWEAGPEDAGAAAVRRTMEGVERRIENGLDDLPGGVVGSHLDVARDHYRASLASLNEQRELVARDASGAREVADVAERQLDRTRRELDAAGAGYERHAERSLTRATVGSAAAILLLLIAFGFCYHRAVKARDRLRKTLTSLERAQRDRSHLLARTVHSAEQERMRIAAELHDGPIQHLASLGFVLDRAQRRFRHGDAGKGLEHLERARKDLTHDVVGLRRLMAELRPPVLDEGGLEAAIHDYASAFAEEHRLAVEIEADLDGAELAPEIETVIYRVAQESLSNVARHAGAERVRVLVQRHADGAELRIDDDGAGFDPASLPMLLRQGHYGVMGMRERVENVGGVWELDSSPATGTSVRVTLPASPRPAVAEHELAVAS